MASIGSSIPVLRMLDEAAARRFFLDFLGYEVEWEHRFNDSPASPLYMQIRLGDSVLHLNGHADDDAPVCEVRVPVQGIGEFCAELQARCSAGQEKPVIVDPRYEGVGTDLNLIDPSGNMLVFWRRE